MNILQNVTPIKLNETNVADASFSSLESQCSYFNINEWSDNDVSDGANAFSASSHDFTAQHHAHSLTPPKTEARKVLFAESSFPAVEKNIKEKG